jgi:hypothetical protein
MPAVMWSRYIMWRGNFMLNWAINRPITGKTSNHRLWPVDTGPIDIANTADIERLLYAQNGMWHCLLHEGQIGRRCYYGGYSRVAVVGLLQERCNSSVVDLRGTSKTYGKSGRNCEFEFHFRILCASAALQFTYTQMCVKNGTEYSLKRIFLTSWK